MNFRMNIAVIKIYDEKRTGTIEESSNVTCPYNFSVLQIEMEKARKVRKIEEKKSLPYELIVVGHPVKY